MTAAPGPIATDTEHKAEQPFTEPWHAEVFSITVELSRAGHFSWNDWTNAFGKHLAAAASSGGATDGSNYYDVWLETLESVLVDRRLAEATDLQSLKNAWTEAYERTPHGQPVRLATTQNSS